MVIINACLLRSVNFVWKISKSSPLLQLHGTSDIQTGNDVLSFAKILFMVIINACLLRSVNFVWKISKSSPLLQLHGTSDIQTGNDVLSFAKILFMVIINACTRKWCSDDYKVKVGDKLPFCQSWGFPRSEKDQFRPFLTYCRKYRCWNFQWAVEEPYNVSHQQQSLLYTPDTHEDIPAITKRYLRPKRKDKSISQTEQLRNL